MRKIVLLLLVALLLTGCASTGTKEPADWRLAVKPDKYVINSDAGMALAESMIASETVLTVEEIDAILGPLGFNSDTLGEVSKTYTVEDFKRGRANVSSGQLMLESIEASLSLYKASFDKYVAEHGIQTDQTAEDVLEWYRQETRKKHAE